MKSRLMLLKQAHHCLDIIEYHLALISGDEISNSECDGIDNCF